MSRAKKQTPSPQGSLHEKHLNIAIVHGGVQLYFVEKATCNSNGCKVDLLRSPAPPETESRGPGAQRCGAQRQCLRARGVLREKPKGKPGKPLLGTTPLTLNRGVGPP